MRMCFWFYVCWGDLFICGLAQKTFQLLILSKEQIQLHLYCSRTAITKSFLFVENSFLSLGKYVLRNSLSTKIPGKIQTAAFKRRRCFRHPPKQVCMLSGARRLLILCHPSLSRSRSSAEGSLASFSQLGWGASRCCSRLLVLVLGWLFVCLAACLLAWSVVAVHYGQGHWCNCFM